MSQSRDLRFHKGHLWCWSQGDGSFIVGMSDHAQGSLGDIVYFDLPTPGMTLSIDESFGSVESTKVVNDLIAPLSGEVLEINPAIEEDPTLANTDPYGDGWLLVVRVDNGEVDSLMDEKAYERHVQGEG